MNRIALLAPLGTPAVREGLARTTLVARRLGMEARTFGKSEDVVDFEPDCVLAWSCQDAKLTRFPTYGVLAPPVEQYMRTKRFLRNVLTYDASLTLSDVVRRWVADLAFGARKFSCPVGRFGCTVQATSFDPRLGDRRLAYVGSAVNARVAAVLERIGRTESIDRRGSPGSVPSGADRPILEVPFDGHSVLDVYRAAGIGLDLPTATQTGVPSTRLLEIVAASAVVITSETPELRRIFGESLLYVDGNASAAEQAEQVQAHLAWVRAHRASAAERARAAHETFSSTFAMERLFPALLDLHARVLVEKGYQPDPDPAVKEDDLPSATYIMRTGGGRSLALIRRALDSMVAQQYPKLRALFVLFRPMPEAAQLRAEYPSLHIDVVEDFGGLRSTAICAGMRHVTTDFFGLLDDDDVLNPNHVRMLVKALQYHNGRNWRGRVRMAYSGSIELGDAQPRAEHGEYADSYALLRREKRVMEHYRTYSSTQMSQHCWYLINSWLASRDLIDDELLSDPRIHTCEDLYVALQLAQRTFLAFSGEVTMNHCYLDVSSTIVDAHRHLADTLRGAVRHWSRLLPTETGFSGALMPTGRPAELCSADESGSNLVGHLLARRQDLLPAGGVVLDANRDSPLEIESIPIELEQARFALRVEADDLSTTGTRPAWLRIEVVDGGDPSRRIASSGFAVDELDWRGDLRCATLRFRILDQRPVTIRVERAPNVSLTIRRLVLLREPAETAGREAPPTAMVS